ncbi:MAG: OmpH family outer membrane protein [Halieaceae bacterium]|jgi:outer membrane protein|nr:OmpH family outer membrane protein [Halieaceae bacterium]
MKNLFTHSLASLAVVAIVFAVAPSGAMAQGKIAVVNLQEAILQSDMAQQRLASVRAEESYKADKSEFDRLKEELDDLVKDFQKDAAVMSQEQQISARKRLASKQADLEHVAGKLQQAEQATGQALLQEMSPLVQEVLRELIATEGIGLLLQRTSVIHADPGYSITAKVTDKLNQATAQ